VNKKLTMNENNLKAKYQIDTLDLNTNRIKILTMRKITMVNKNNNSELEK